LVILAVPSCCLVASCHCLPRSPSSYPSSHALLRRRPMQCRCPGPCRPESRRFMSYCSLSHVLFYALSRSVVTLPMPIILLSSVVILVVVLLSRTSCLLVLHLVALLYCLVVLLLYFL